MIAPSDKDYQQTKQFMKAGALLESPFKQLADWVESTYSVHVLNVICDTVAPDNRPRLSVVLEFQEDALRFKEGAVGNYNRIDQQRVKECFESILLDQKNTRFRTEGLLVIFVAFEPVARAEAHQKVTEPELHRLKAKLGNQNLWEISRCFESVTFFFYTDAQVKQAEAQGLKESYAEEYWQLVQPHDEFGYLRKRGVRVGFDSKENLDSNYKSIWFYYYR